MEENQTLESHPQAVERTANNSKKNIGVIISFIVVLLVASVVLISRLYPNAHKKQLQSMNQTKTTLPVANVMYQHPISPTPTLDTSDAQLDKDLQNAQDSLNNLDTDITNAVQ